MLTEISSLVDHCRWDLIYLRWSTYFWILDVMDYIHYLTLNKDVYHKLLEEMRDRVGSDQGDKLKSYIYDQNT